MGNLLSTSDVVKSLLEERPATRDSDNILICLVYSKLGYSFKKPFCEIMEAVEHSKLPTMESITRCRRKLQEKYPHLRGDKYNARMDEEQKYIEYAKGESV